MAAQQLTEPANLPPAPGFADSTLRQVVRVSLGGTQIRVRFSNEFGTTPLTLTAAHVAKPAGAPRPAGQVGSHFTGNPARNEPASNLSGQLLGDDRAGNGRGFGCARA
jgi:hypothetical protein